MCDLFSAPLVRGGVAMGMTPCEVIGCAARATWALAARQDPVCEDALCEQHYLHMAERHPEWLTGYLLAPDAARADASVAQPAVRMLAA